MKNILPRVPGQVVEEVVFQVGTIISKVLLQSEKLNLTIFAVAKDQEFSPHTTTKEAVIHILEGEGQFMLGEKWYDFKSGDFFYMPQNYLHAIKAKTNFKFLLYLF